MLLHLTRCEWTHNGLQGLFLLILEGSNWESSLQYADTIGSLHKAVASFKETDEYYKKSEYW